MISRQPVFVSKGAILTARLLIASLLVVVVSPSSLAFGAAKADELPKRGGVVCDVRTYGAIGDGRADDTLSVQAAIDDCARSGGQVFLPTGRWLTGTIELRSHVDFHLSGGAVLLGSRSVDDYRVLPKDPGRRDPGNWYRAHLVGLGIENTRISGLGTIDGQGKPFWDKHYALGRPTDHDHRPERQMSLVDCRNIRVDNLSLVNTAMYGLVFQDCDDVTVDGVTVNNPADSPNTDGIVIRDTKNAIITGVRIATGDDAIVVKSDDRFVDNLLVTNSIVASDNAALKFGTAGRVGVRNSLFTDIIIDEAREGIALYQIDGGIFRNNRFHNIRITTGGRTKRHYPIFVDVGRRHEGGFLGEIDGLTFSRIDATSSGNIVITGQAGSPIKGLSLEDIVLQTSKRSYPLIETRSKPRGSRLLEATKDDEDHSSVPAQLTLAHIDDLTISNFRIRHQDSERARSAVWLKHVRDAKLSVINIDDEAAGDLPLMEIADVQALLLRDLEVVEGTSTLIRAGENVGRLSFRGVDGEKAEQVLEGEAEAIDFGPDRTNR